MPKKATASRGGMKGVRPGTTTSTMPARSNKGGALRGATRAAFVKAANATRATTRSPGREPGGNLASQAAANVRSLTKSARATATVAKANKASVAKPRTAKRR